MSEKQTKKQSTTFNFTAAQEASDRLQGLKQDYKKRVEACGAQKSAALELQENFFKLIAETQWEDREERIPTNPDDGRKYEELKARVKSAFQELHQAEAEAESISNEITGLEKELHSYECNIPVSEVKILQGRCKAASEKITALKRAILAQEEIKGKASSAIPSMHDLDKQRENLLAKIALGDATTKDLDIFDKEYAKGLEATLEAKKQSASVILSADQTIAGLRRCLTEAERELNELITQKDSARLSFLRSEVERVGAEYLNLANALTEKYKSILGLEALMKKFTANPRIRTVNCEDFRIPMFNIGAFKAQLVRAPGGTFPEAENAGSHHFLLAYLNAEIERIMKLGIDWD